MSYFEITGGIPLHGEVRCSGAKNAALPIMAASILASEPVRLDNVPRVSDVRTQARVLRQLGIEIGPHDDGMELQTVDPTPVRAPQRFVRRMRASFCVLGPLLARAGRRLCLCPAAATSATVRSICI